MIDLNKAIPTIDFVEGRRPVIKPSPEKMVYMNDEFICDSDYYHWHGLGGKAIPGSSPYIMVRETVCRMLHEAESMLPEGYRFKILDAYRPIAVQQALYDSVFSDNRDRFPEKTTEELHKVTQTTCSFPSYNVLLPALHNSGGAVDLTVVDANGDEIDMGGDFDELSDRSCTTYYEPEGRFGGQNDIARDNRRMLYNIMISVGFTNFPTEWWHYDYGDEKWAQFTDSTPFYAGTLDAYLKDATPYNNMEIVREADEREQEIVKEIIRLGNEDEKNLTDLTESLREECRSLDEKVAAVMR